MSTDAPFIPPKKKPSVFWFIGGLFVFLVLIFLFQLFGPNPPIVVSPQTTRIVKPLAADGLPDYEKYVLEMYREGVTPENNAASLIWQALWPGELDPSQYAAVAKELGLEQIPRPEDALQRIYSNENNARVMKWLAQQQAGSAPKNGDVPPTDSAALIEAGVPYDSTPEGMTEELISRATSRPWTSEQIPPLAKWVAENKKPLDMLVEASHRPRCYFPSPSLIDNKGDSLVAILLPGVQSAREVSRALPARAMWHLGEGRTDDAWQDLLAVHRVGQLTTQGHTLVEILVGIAIQGIACEGTVTLLDQGKLTADQARQIQRDLNAIPHLSGVSQSIDRMERMLYLDAVSRHRHESLGDVPNGIFEVTDHVSIDWNVALRKGNEFYDRLVKAAELPTYTERQQEYARVDADIQRMAGSIRPSDMVAAVLNPHARSDTVASAMLAMFLPALAACDQAQDRANSNLDLVRLAAALAVYRAEHDAYPTKLEELVPAVLDKLPVDLFHAKPFIYKRTADGYLLYSAGANGNDDGGSNEQTNVFEGRETVQTETETTVTPTPQPQIPTGADDWSIRVPRPVFELPKKAVLPGAEP